jgi:hypothetical protein
MTPELITPDELPEVPPISTSPPSLDRGGKLVIVAGEPAAGERVAMDVGAVEAAVKERDLALPVDVGVAEGAAGVCAEIEAGPAEHRRRRRRRGLLLRWQIGGERGGRRHQGANDETLQDFHFTVRSPALQ